MQSDIMDPAYLDLSITSANPATTASIHDFAHELVSHGSGAGAILTAADADHEAPLASAYAAAACLTLMTREGQQRAAKPLSAAIAHRDTANAREQQTIAAITAWHLGDEAKAVRILRGIVEVWPNDLVAMKLCQILEINLGDVRGMLRTSGMAAAVAGRSGYALGLHAFALEQAGETSLAMRFARRAIERSPGMDPWAEHCVAHAFAASGQLAEGRAFLHAHCGGWDRCSSFMLTHNWWHLALFELDLGNRPIAFDLLVRRIWGVRKAHSQDQINAISMLARLEIDGVHAPDIWDDIAGHVEGRSGDNMNIFLDLHCLYALARAGRDRYVQGMLERFDPQNVAGAVAHALAAHAKQDYMLAASLLAPVRRDFQALGGSNVQRGLFERIFADSVIRCRDGQFTETCSAPVARFNVAA